MKMDKIRKSTFLIGLNDKDEKRQIITDGAARRIIENAFARRYDGATFSEAVGLYMGGFENSIRVEVLWSESAKDAAICEELKKALNQDCIYLEVADVCAAYV